MRVADYVVTDQVATSPVATMYRATGPSGIVALKCYDHAVAPEPTAAQLELRHPAVARLLDIGDLDGGGYFVAAEWIDGAPLSSLLDRPASWETIRRIIGAIGSGLGALHARGVVHRDLKPSNVIIPSSHACAAVIVDAWPVLGTAGTTPYAAPERVAGLPIDGRADLYALGVIVFQLLTGALPTDDASLPHDTPRVADALCTWLLAPDRDMRVPNAHVLAVTLGAATSELGALCGATVGSVT
jgi:serine/threonine protein kinase